MLLRVTLSALLELVNELVSAFDRLFAHCADADDAKDFRTRAVMSLDPNPDPVSNPRGDALGTG